MVGIFPNRMMRLSMSAFDPAGLGHQERPETRDHLRRVIEVFIEGYNVALDTPDLQAVCALIDSRFDDHFRGFAYEGVGMLLAVRDLMKLRAGRQLVDFCAGRGRSHHYIAAVGVGFAFARVPFGTSRVDGYLAALSPRDRWCAFDGYAFHQAVFHKRKYLDEQHRPRWLRPEWYQPFYGGLGRSLWWVEGAAPRRIAATIGRFPALVRPDMWHGVGIAASYAGGIGEDELDQLVELAGDARESFVAGVPYAVQMRVEGGNPSPWTDTVSRRLLGEEPAAVSRRTDEILETTVRRIEAGRGDVGTQIYGLGLEALRAYCRSRLAGLARPAATPLRDAHAR